MPKCLFPAMPKCCNIQLLISRNAQLLISCECSQYCFFPCSAAYFRPSFRLTEDNLFSVKYNCFSRLIQDILMSQPAKIVVASLNFSGINTNPFEYNDGTALFEALNRNFLQIKSAEFPETQKWVGALLDKHFKNNRFTVLFGNQLVQSIGQKLPNKEQFHKIWHLFYDAAVASGKIKYEAKVEEVEDVQKMDYAFYRAVVMAVYDYKTLKEYEAHFPEESPAKLADFLLVKRASAPFQLKLKKQLVLKYHKGVDVMFLQEAGSVEWQQQEGYTRYSQHDSVILYKSELFGQVDQQQTKKWQHLLDINSDTAAVFTTKGFLLISSHFKSSAPFYYQQEHELFKVLNYVIDYYFSKPYKIIIGVDANHRIESAKISNGNICPKQATESSSIKKRSYIQAQLHKADQAVDQLKDHVISTLEIKDYRLELIDGSENKKDLLPNDRHPYDHYIVKAWLDI